jgi:hypothetical protein
MTTSIIHKTLVNIEGISDFKERDTIFSEDVNYYNFSFVFTGMTFVGSQISSPLFTLNRFSLPFRFTLKKDTTKANVLDAINQYNLERPLMKVFLTNMSGKKIELSFSADFINNDNDIKESQLLPLVNIMGPSPSDFVKYLNQKNISISLK